MRARRPAITVPEQDSDDFFTDGKDGSYSMTDDDLGSALSGRLSELANGVISPSVRHEKLIFLRRLDYLVLILLIRDLLTH